MNNTIRAAQAQIRKNLAQIQELMSENETLNSTISDTRLALWRPGKKVRVSGTAGDVLAEGRVVQSSALNGGESMYALLTNAGEIRLWNQLTLQGLNVEEM